VEAFVGLTAVVLEEALQQPQQHADPLARGVIGAANAARIIAILATNVRSVQQQPQSLQPQQQSLQPQQQSLQQHQQNVTLSANPKDTKVDLALYFALINQYQAVHARGIHQHAVVKEHVHLQHQPYQAVEI